MNCEFTEKVSQLVDGELEREEAERLSAHVAGCALCQKAQADFLLLRREIRAYEPTLDSITERRALSKILASESVPLWRRSVAIPAPVFALLVLAVMAFGVWSAASMLIGGTGHAETRKEHVEPPHAGAPESGIDLARFDGGGRAFIYKAKRAKNGGHEQ